MKAIIYTYITSIHLKSYINFLLYRLNEDQFGLAAAVAFMGAPLVLNEKLINGQESTQCLHVMQNILASGKQME